MKTKYPIVLYEDDILSLIKNIKLPKHKLAILLGFYQCMRVSEVAKLKKDDIDYNQKLIHIKQAKGHKDRIIPIAPEVFNKLRFLPCGSDKAKDFGIRSLQIMFNKITLKVLGKKYNFHILRHSGITFYLTKKKWNTMQVQRLAGHSKSSITEIYTHINPQDLVDAMWKNGNFTKQEE